MDGAGLVADDAVLEQLPRRTQERGGIGYLQFVSAWLRAFPDAVFSPQRIAAAGGLAYEVDLVATGTHRGPLDLAGWVFRPTGTHATFRLRELLQLREDKIIFSSMSLDLHDIIDKLAKCDLPALLTHIQHLQQLAADLQAARHDAIAARALTERIGQELDQARHVVRPYYRR